LPLPFTFPPPASHARARARRPHVASLEAEDYKFRWLLLTSYGAAGDYLRAATTLAGARLDSTSVSDEERARAYVRLAQCVRARRRRRRRRRSACAARPLRRRAQPCLRTFAGTLSAPTTT